MPELGDCKDLRAARTQNKIKIHSLLSRNRIGQQVEQFEPVRDAYYRDRSIPWTTRSQLYILTEELRNLENMSRIREIEMVHYSPRLVSSAWGPYTPAPTADHSKAKSLVLYWHNTKIEKDSDKFGTLVQDIFTGFNRTCFLFTKSKLTGGDFAKNFESSNARPSNLGWQSPGTVDFGFTEGADTVEIVAKYRKANPGNHLMVGISSDGETYIDIAWLRPLRLQKEPHFVIYRVPAEIFAVSKLWLHLEFQHNAELPDIPQQTITLDWLAFRVP